MKTNSAPHPAFSRRRAAVILSCILVLAGFYRFAYLESLRSNPLVKMVCLSDIFDQYRFITLAREFVNETWLGTETTYYSPAYSYFIAAVFKIFSQDIFWVFAVQMVAGLAATVLMYRTCRLLFDNRFIGLIGAVMIAFYSPLVFYEGCLLRASLVAYGNLASFYFLLKGFSKGTERRWFFLGGAALGFSAALRPNVLLFFLLPYIFFHLKATRKRKFIAAVVFLLGVLVMTYPISIRNQMLKENTLISRQGPSVFWIGNTPDATGIGLHRSPLRWKFVKEADGSAVKTLQILGREAAQNPKAYVRLYFQKILMYFNGYEIPANINYYLFLESNPILAFGIFNFVIIAPLALLGLFRAGRASPHMSLCYLYLAVLAVSVILFHIQGRYRIPAIPFFIVFAAFSVGWLTQLAKEKRYNRLVKGILIVILWTLVTLPNTTIIDRHFGGFIRRIDYSNLGHAYIFQYQKMLPQENTTRLNDALREARHYLYQSVRGLDVKRLRPGSRFAEIVANAYQVIGLIDLHFGERTNAERSLYYAYMLNNKQPSHIHSLERPYIELDTFEP